MTDSVKNPVDFTFNIDTQDKASDELQMKQADDPLCISILGDFSGRQKQQDAGSIEQRIFKEIDRYDYDEVLAYFNINLHLAMQGDTNGIDIPIRQYKDFHPDQLYKNVDVFSKLRDLRQRLQNNATFDDAAREIQGWLIAENKEEITAPPITQDKVKKNPEAATAASVEAEAIPSDNLLDAILDETARNMDATETNTTDADNKVSLVDGFIKQMMSNRVKVSATPRKDEMLAAVDEAISESMRAILHHPDFQALESAWQALRFIVRRVKTGKNLKIYLLDVTKDELTEDLSREDVTQSGLYKLFCDPVHGDIKWRYISGNYRFRADIDDMLLLSQLGYVAMRSGATFISSADEKIVGCESFSKTPDVSRWDYDLNDNIAAAWSLLRKSEVAKHISLALPCFLIREPYSAMSNPIKSFPFEEMLPPVKHKQYLWANAAFLKTEQLARSFVKSGWDMRPGESAMTEDLPMHSREDKGKIVIQPCAEIPLSETGAARMMQQGIIPLWSVKNRDRIHSGDFFTLYDD